ncbi:hypothetical protein [uncultured Abiotrophia sp.]|uniref:hypothetical protein n=1 Tax=uncultured Abiotrophia sp. TaxID=316094 RepID=UPI00288B8DA9|nr:hypothetical protein [uncultured Abiotrophia sp.]
MNRYLKRIMILLVLVGISTFTYTRWMGHMALRNFDYLEKFYPTKDLRELFKYFPEDFAIIHIREFAEEGSSGKSIRVIIKGESKTQKISAIAELYKVLPDKNEEEIETVNLTYKGGVSFDIPKDKKISTYLNDFELLMANYDYRAEDFANAKPLDIYDNPVQGYYERRYHFEATDSLSSDYGVDFSKSKYVVEFGKSLLPFDRFFDSTIRIRMQDPESRSNEARTMIICSETISAARSNLGSER